MYCAVVFFEPCLALGASSDRLLSDGGQVSSIGSDPRWDIIRRWLISRWRLEEVAFLLLPFQTAALELSPRLSHDQKLTGFELLLTS